MLVSMQHTTHRPAIAKEHRIPMQQLYIASVSLTKTTKYTKAKKLIRKRKLKILLIISDETLCPHSLRRY